MENKDVYINFIFSTKYIYITPNILCYISSIKYININNCKIIIYVCLLKPFLKYLIDFTQQR